MADEWIRKSIDERAARQQAEQAQAQEERQRMEEASRKANEIWIRVRQALDDTVARYNSLVPDPQQQIGTSQERVGSRTVTYFKSHPQASVTITLATNGSVLGCSYAFPNSTHRPQTRVEQVMVLEQNGVFVADNGSGAGAPEIARYVLEEFFQA
jgi:ElaB/YqjD/DUF883 family membrane-anchored ribosome-binding protein